MKRYQLLAAALIMMIGTTAYAQDISVYVDNKNIALEVQPQIKNDTAYLPVSIIAGELDADVKWEDPNVIITNDYYKIICSIGNKTAYKNGIPILLPEAPFIYNNRTFISSLGISKLLDCDVDYQKADNKIAIIKHDIIEQKMKKLGVMDYCVAGDWVYFVTLGDNEGIHKMALDGTQDTIICGLPEIDISGSTSVSSAFRNDCIIFKFQQMSQYDENGVLESPYPSYYYKLNLLNNTMTAFSDKQNSDANQIEDIAEKFAQAYFSKDLTGVSAYLDDGTEPETYAENIWTDSSDFRLKWTPEIILSSENAISVQIEFALPGNDSYDYLDLSFSSNSGQWKINSFGLEK